MSFCHLHTHTHYSPLEASSSVDDLINLCLEFNMPGCALTDYGNMFGAVEFFEKAKERNIKPILGLEVYISEGSYKEKSREKTRLGKLVLLAKDYKAYQNLCQISSIGYKEGFYYKPRVDYSILEKYKEGLICLSGGHLGQISQTYLNQGGDQAISLVKDLKKIFKDSFYLELNRHGLKEDKNLNDFLLNCSSDLKLPFVASNNTHYSKKEDYLIQESLICIGTNRTLDDDSRFRFLSQEYYFKSIDQMKELFKAHPEAIKNSLEILDRCNMEFKNKDKKGRPIYHLPSYPTKLKNLKEEIKNLSEKGLVQRLKEKELRGEKKDRKSIKEYEKRLEYELKIINQMGFSGYFLIVYDFIKWARSQKIPVGSGRGSGASSLVAYCLYITNIDPLEYNLLFERFLNPERISMPDFDIDFCQDKRGDLINYVTEKYGEKSVAQIITFGRFQARGAVRDIGRILGMTYLEVDQVAKMIPEKLGINLDEALKTSPKLKDLIENNAKIKKLIELSKKIEGLIRHVGIHASGVIIADGDITDYVPLYRGLEGENVIQFDMKYSEKIGLIKFDFLGLKTLTLIDKTLKLIKKTRNKEISLEEISVSDPGIYKILCKGDTLGVFQFESSGITDLIVKAQPSRFEDIVAINALFRPGPMDMIPEYLKRKKGEVEFDYLFDEMKEITEETYGVIVYQEQVQLIASKIANYSLGEADILRRAMGKKISSVMKKQKSRFLEGAKKNKYDLKKSERLFNLVSEFAKYGFNKSHAAAYCMTAAYTAYLKHYYTVEFLASLLSTEMHDTDKVLKYIRNVRSYGIKIRPPSINHSDYEFSVKDNCICYALGAIKGLGQAAVSAIIEIRDSLENKSFDSIDHFFRSICKRSKINKKSIEALIKAGCFDEFGIKRDDLFENSQKLYQKAIKLEEEKDTGQMNFFDQANEKRSEFDQFSLKAKKAWSNLERLNYEKEVLGFYFSKHPLFYFSDSKKWSTKGIKKLYEEARRHQKIKEEVQVVGIVSSFKEVVTKKGSKMAFCILEDLSSSIELVVFSRLYSSKTAVLKSELPIWVKGDLSYKEGSLKLLAQNLELLEANH